MYSPLRFSSFFHPTSSLAFVTRRCLSSAATTEAKKKNLEEFPNIQADTSKGLKFQLMVAVILERFPVIAPPPTDLELRYEKMLRALEDENSLLNYHELRREADRKAAKKATSKKVIETDERQIITAQDFEDASIAERKKFVVAPPTSGEDDNLQSLNRLLHKKLIFLTPAIFGDKNFWDLPRTILREGETLSQAAQRCLTENLDLSPAATFYGNAPRKLYKVKYPKPIMEKTGALGAKIFMFKAELPYQGKITPRVQNFRWLSRDELKTAIKDGHYCKSIQYFVFE